MPVMRMFERDVDLLLAEEFSVSLPFARWFLEQLNVEAPSGLCVIDVTVSKVHDTLGETDLEVIYEITESDQCKRFAVLIENKINAPLQAAQIDRYRSRAEDALNSGQYQESRVILCAPEAYGLTHPESKKFDAFISYEKIAEYLKTRSANDDSSRDRYRAQFLIQTPRLSTLRQSSGDRTIDAFWITLYGIAASDFRELEMQEPHFKNGQMWTSFQPTVMPRGVSVGLMLQEGWVDLTFANVLLKAFRAIVESFLEQGMSLQKKGLAAVIRFNVKPLKVLDVAEDTETTIRTSLGACSKMVDFYKAHQQVLDSAAADSPLN